MNQSQSGLMTYRSFIRFCVTPLLLLFSACNGFDKTNAEIAIKKYVQRTFYRPDTYKALHYYTPKKMTVSTNPADRNNSSFSKDKNQRHCYQCWLHCLVRV